MNDELTPADNLRVYAIDQSVEEMERFQRKLLAVKTAISNNRWNASGPEVRACKRSMTDLKLQLKNLWAALK